MNKKITIGNTWFAPALGLLFITLKLTGVITWSWWWVLSPFWIPIAIFLVAFLVLIIVAFIRSYKD